MNVLITGASGQLGSHLAQVLPHAVALTRADLDITDISSVRDAANELEPDVVINAAAYTAVDAAESDEAGADAVNHRGPAHLAAALTARGGRLIHVSTDYVFAGGGSRPLQTSDPTGPLTVYGRTKLAGERAALEAMPSRCTVVRTAWVYGGPGPNFVDTMRRLEAERDSIDVVDDQIGSPTWVADLAVGLAALVGHPATEPVLHYVNAGKASWFELARETFRLLGADPARIRPIAASAFPRPAPRPAWSVLSTTSWTSAGLPEPRDWQSALAEYLSVKV